MEAMQGSGQEVSHSWPSHELPFVGTISSIGHDKLPAPIELIDSAGQGEIAFFSSISQQITNILWFTSSD